MSFPKKALNKNAVCVSAPGKVLIAGGYLVLERPNLGVTIAATSRFFTSIALGAQEKPEKNCLYITVKSPQFFTEYGYVYNYADGKLSAVSGESNPFVQKCLALSLAFSRRYLGSETIRRLFSEVSETNELTVLLRADNDFYSQIKELRKRNLPLLSCSLEALPQFMPCPTDEHGRVEIAKTGLGSSAALTTSLVGALLQWLEVIHIENAASVEDKRIVHNLAQLVHGNAQGKIGSGFDVASAVYGTQVYTRFCAESFVDCLSDQVDEDALYNAVMLPPTPAPALTPIATASAEGSGSGSDRSSGSFSGNGSGWCQRVEPFSLPQGIDMVLGDICGGSSSASMARKVLQWRRDEPEKAEKLWAALRETNFETYRCLKELNTQQESNAASYQAMVEWASCRSAEDWTQRGDHETVRSLLCLRALLLTARQQLKALGEGAGVGIEPDAQTRLADATAALPGVISAGVPGAGGADAIFALTLSESARKRVEKMWSTWGRSEGSGGDSCEITHVCPLILRAGGGSSAGIMAHVHSD